MPRKLPTDTGWKPLKIVGGDGDQHAASRVEMVRGTEARPCLTCKHWERDERRLIEHLLAHGLELRDDGKFVTPIARDLPGRKSLVIDPKQSGFCRAESSVTQDLATCEKWQPVTTMSELQSRIR